MARIEKTVFISYRRKDISWALAVYQYLTSQKYDVFFDYTSIPSGDFEQIIVSNIKARAHFILILTPTALDRCSNPNDWLRREIETALDEKRNFIPLFFDEFDFGNPAVKEKLTGKLASINRYNGLDVPSGYFLEAMQRLSSRYLNVPLTAVLHPVSTEVQKVVKEEQFAANEALEQRKNIEEVIKPSKNPVTNNEVHFAKSEIQKTQLEPSDEQLKTGRIFTDLGGHMKPQGSLVRKFIPAVEKKQNLSETRSDLFHSPKRLPYALYLVGVGILIAIIFGLNYLIQNDSAKQTFIQTGLAPSIALTYSPTFTYQSIQTVATITNSTITLTPTRSGPTEYIIQEGDTLPGIAEKFELGNDGVLLLIDNNPEIMRSNGVYFVGQKLFIPAPGTARNTPTPIGDIPSGMRIDYQVLPGDTLAGIAAKFNSKTENIIAVNNIANSNALTVGQTLIIPVNLVTATPTRTDTPAGPLPLIDSHGATMLLVSAGIFQMGAISGDLRALTEEKPIHEVQLDAYYIDKYEVTNALYKVCVDAGECDLPIQEDPNIRDRYFGIQKFDLYPVVNVNWDMAQTYCEWRGARLPTEAEWEKAARGDVPRLYPWEGTEFSCQFANYNQRCVYGTTQVGIYESGKSPYGSYDMAGNVWEWVSDWYSQDYYGISFLPNPPGPVYGQAKVARGGSWASGDDDIRTSKRIRFPPGKYNFDLGFRCAMSAP